MLEIIETVTMSPRQYKVVIEGMRNPMNSWGKSDSRCVGHYTVSGCDEFVMGDNDLVLMKNLASLPPEHAKYRRMMPVWVTINAPLYWWKQFDTYQIGRVSNSCSTMHRIASKPFVLSDFSHEHLTKDNPWRDKEAHRNCSGAEMLEKYVIPVHNHYRELYLETHSETHWWQMIQLLPSSYNQRRTVFLTYETLSNIFRQRKNHKLDEWHEFCDWIGTLPYPELITTEVRTDGISR